MIPTLRQPGLSGDAHIGNTLAEKGYINAGLGLWWRIVSYGCGWTFRDSEWLLVTRIDSDWLIVTFPDLYELEGLCIRVLVFELLCIVLKDDV